MTPQSRERLRDAVAAIPRLAASVPFCAALCLACASVMAWTWREVMTPDGVSYVDMASAAVQGRVGELVSTYWSPGYPALLALAFWLTEPTAAWQFQVVHIVNLLIFAGTLASFLWWIRAESRGEDASGPGAPAGYETFAPFALCVFLWLVLLWIEMRRVTPDILVALFVFLAAGAVCRLADSGTERRTWAYARLGGVLALGYWAKTAMFPLGLALLAILFVAPPDRVRRSGLLVSLGVFLLVSAPLAALVSARAGHPTLGESGRLNYAWYVDGVQVAIGWTGGPTDEYGVPEHPPRTLVEQPRTLEFREPIGGTFPLWYEAPYWYAGVEPAFDLRGQLAAVQATLRSYALILLKLDILVAGALVLLGMTWLERRQPAIPRDRWWQLAWPLAACVMYSLVYVNVRYLGGFAVLLCLGVYRVLASRVDPNAVGPVLATIGCALVLSFATEVVPDVGSAVSDAIHSRSPAHAVVARALREEGVEEGDAIAVVGDAHDAYYALYARVQIIAQVPDAAEFWAASPEQHALLRRRLSDVGVEVLVAPDRPAAASADGWRDVPIESGERVSIQRIRPNGP